MKVKNCDSKEADAYILGTISLILALFIPFSALLLKIFENNSKISSIIISAGIPFLAVILGIFGLIKSLKCDGKRAKKAKILSILSILIGFFLVAINLYTFIKYSVIGIR